MNRILRTMFHSNWGRILAVVAGLAACSLTRDQADATSGNRVKTSSIKGVVADSQGRPIVGATVYFLETSRIDTTSVMTPTGILAATTDGYDEPLEDILNLPEQAATLPQAVTNDRGQFRIKGLTREANYYAYVVPATGDTDHLPGGNASRKAFTPKGVSRSGLRIVLSWTPPADATYIGTTACYLCHDKENFKKHAHQLGFQVPGKRTANQDISAHKDYDNWFTSFKEATSYASSGVKVLFYENYDSTRTDNWKIFEDATGGGRVDVKVYLWKTAGQYKVTMENVRNPADPPRTYNANLVYGGAVYKQRLLLQISGRKGLYPFLQYQGFSTGDSLGKNTYYEQTRRLYRDYRMSQFYAKGPDGSIGTADDLLTIPGVDKSFETSCGACHFTGFSTFKDATTGEQLANAVPDINGTYDANGDGVPEEINIGCESCHGPGSKHREEALLSDEGSGKTLVSRKAKHIVQPEFLSAGRAALICGRCHDRIKGQSSKSVDEAALNTSNQLAPVGIGRAEYLANYANPSQRSYAAGSLWGDSLHGKAHRPQYYNWLCSKHARNEKQLVTCFDCHDMHGESEYRWFLKGNPDDSEAGLCNQCHKMEIVEHAKEKTGDDMAGAGMTCVGCHMVKTAQTAAGRPGLLLGAPTGASSDANLEYWENDICSHLMDVPDKFTKGVAGTQPGKAMPVPYTNSCGTCHDASGLQYQAPH